MKITFAAIGSEQLAISLLSGILKEKGHETSVAFTASLFHDRWNLEIKWLGEYFDDTELLLNQFKDANPDVVCFSCLTSTYKWAIDVAEKLKEWKPSIKTIFGGVHVTAVPDRTIQKAPVDYVVTGEGEVAVPQIVQRIENGEQNEEPIPNTRFQLASGEVVTGQQTPFYQDMDNLPWFDKQIWEDVIPMSGKYMTMASRGCPYRCSFCFNNFFAKLPETKSKGSYVRFRSVDHVLGELKWALQRYKKIRYIDFQDDVFTANKKWLREFATRYKEEIDLPFQCLTHPQFMDEENARLLNWAGCKWIQMGVQSMDDEYKKKIKRLERSNNITEACRVMKKYNIRAKLDHMFGLPGEPISAQEKALNLYREHTPSRLQTFWVCYLPGTDMMREGIEDGTVSQEDAERLYEGDNFYFFQGKDTVEDAELDRLYSAYEFIFKMLPILPYRLRMKIEPSHVKWIPRPIRATIMNVADFINGFRYRNPDFLAYLIHNLFHIKRFIIWRFTGKVIKLKNRRQDGNGYLESWKQFKKSQQTQEFTKTAPTASTIQNQQDAVA